MKFWRKFWLFVVAIVSAVLLHLFVKEIGRLEFSIAEKEYSIGIYVIVFVLLVFWCICFVIKSFFVWFLSLFFKNRTAEEIKSISEIAKLIVADHYDFLNLFEKATVVESLKVLKIALALKRGVCKEKTFEKTGLHCVDIYIIKRDLDRILSGGDLNEAITIANKVLRSYCGYVRVVKEELLEIAKRAKQHSVAFSFDPSKFKYDLPQSFINEYNVSLGIVSFEMEENPERKLRILEKLHKDYPENVEILCKLLDYADGGVQQVFDVKKELALIKETIVLNPNRKLARYLIKTNKADIFETAQEMMLTTPEQNPERLWLLLELATEKGFQMKIKELVEKIIQIDNSDEIYKFYVSHQALLSKIPEILSIINEKNHEDKLYKTAK